MKSSIFLAATGALMALAGPLAKRMVTETDVVVEYYTVTVTEGEPTTTATPTPTPVFVNGGKHRSGKKSTYSPTVHVAPTPTTTPAPVVTTTVQPEKPSTTSTEAESTTVVVVAPAPTTTAEATSVVEATTPTSATSTYVAASSPTDMASTALYAHNLHRANHSAPELNWLDEIATYAETTANTCKFAHDMTQGSGGYGQNIAMWATSDNAAALGAAGAMAMASHDMWYDGEINAYLPSYYGESTPDMSNFEAWGHFSQLVWKESTSLGCYAKLCAKGTMYADMDAWYMVCNYRPAGNVGGGYGSNVLAPLGEATVTS